ncbi:hypothetical protein SH661x_002072 [Planctomicrobium sp. SH661]|uniref:hypothetical protein n=1 Tax=Planctomicrobium sp. SH661 TaxID=3448124 RepID=UPI003F5B3E82
MAADREWTPTLILIALAGGLVGALLQLGFETSGPQAGLAAAAALAVLACHLAFRKQGLSRTLWSAFPGMLAVAWLVASSSSSGPLGLGSAFCWAILVCGATLGLAAVLPQPAASPQTSLKLVTPQDSSPSVPEEILQIAVPVPECLPFPLQEFVDDEFEEGEELESEFESETLNDRTVQHWSRVHSPEEDRLEGTLLVEVPAGQKQAYAHVPFVPFFRTLPTGYCECESEGDEEIEAVLDSIHMYGARVILRRRGNLSEPAAAQVTLIAVSPQANRRAA